MTHEMNRDMSRNRWWGSLRSRIVLRLLPMCLLGLGVTQRAAGQDGTTGNRLPTPLMTVTFPAPRHAVDWSHYQHVDECLHVVDWTRAAHLFDAVDRSPAIDLQRTRDTARDNPWAPLPPAAVDSMQRCLRQIRIADVPPFELPTLRRLSVMANVDSLLQTVVTQQLAHVSEVSVLTRAAILDSVVDLLMQSPGLAGQAVAAQPSPAHLRLAHEYAAQIDALGSGALLKRIHVRKLLIQPAKYANDVSALLAHNREQLQLERALAPSMVKEVGFPSFDSLQTFMDAHYAYLTWMTTGHDADYARFLALASKEQRFSAHFSLLGAPAARVTGDDCFASPTTSTSAPILTPAVPTSGTMAVVAFIPSLAGSDYGPEHSRAFFAMFRRLHEEFPTLAITLVAHAVGYFRGQYLIGHPAQEAAFIHQLLADSLGIPGSVCVIREQSTTMSDGRILPGFSAMARAYDLDLGEDGMFLIDPKGRIVEADGRVEEYDTLIQRLQSAEIGNR